MRGRHLALAALVAACFAMTFSGCNCGSQALSPPLPPLSAVVLTPELDTLTTGQQRQFVAVALDTDSVIVSGAGIAFTPDDPGVISVSSNGLVTAVGEGVTRLVASAGGKADTSVVAVFVQNGWYTQPSGTTNGLNGVFFLPDGRSGWAVGDAGTIVHTANAGVSWGAQASATAFTLNGVWFTTGVTGFAVGNSGTVMRTLNGGNSWTRLTSVSASENLLDVCFADSTHGWAVGTNGAIVRTDDGGASWTKVNPTAFQLNSVSFSDTTNGWAVGEGGVIAGTHDGGRSWYVVQPSVTSLAIKAVWRNANTLAWAGGSQGVYAFTTPTPDSLQWTLGTFGATNNVLGLQMVDDVTGYAVGTNGQGLILKTENAGVIWSPQVSNTTQQLNDVYFVDSLRGWAVGAAGRIVHTARGGL